MTAMFRSIRAIATTDSVNVVISPLIELGMSAIDGLGLLARTRIRPGTPIAKLDGNLIRDVPSDTYPNSIGIGRDTWIDPGLPFSHINHSCDANAAFGPRRTAYALRTIAAGEEITIDYSTTEVDPHWSLQCRCGTDTCRGVLRAIQFAFPEATTPPLASPLFLKYWRRAIAGAQPNSVSTG